MHRALLLASQPAEPSTAHAIQTLCQGRQGDWDITARFIGRGCEYASPWRAAWKLWSQREFQLVHAFGPQALSAIRHTYPGPVCYTPLPGERPTPGRRGIDRLIVPSNAMAQAWKNLNYPVHIIPPGIGLPADNDPHLREKINLPPDSRLIALAGPAERPYNHRLALWIGHLAHYIDPRIFLLLPAEGSAQSANLRFAKKISGLDFYRPAPDVDPYRMYQAADLVLNLAEESASPLYILKALASARPIVTLDNSLSRQFLNNDNATFTRDSNPVDICRIILEKLESAQPLAYKNEPAARTVVEKYSAQKFISAHLEEYRDLLTAPFAPSPASG